MPTWFRSGTRRRPGRGGLPRPPPRRPPRVPSRARSPAPRHRRRRGSPRSSAVRAATAARHPSRWTGAAPSAGHDGHARLGGRVGCRRPGRGRLQLGGGGREERVDGGTGELVADVLVDAVDAEVVAGLAWGEDREACPGVDGGGDQRQGHRGPAGGVLASEVWSRLFDVVPLHDDGTELVVRRRADRDGRASRVAEAAGSKDRGDLVQGGVGGPDGPPVGVVEEPAYDVLGGCRDGHGVVQEGGGAVGMPCSGTGRRPRRNPFLEAVGESAEKRLDRGAGQTLTVEPVEPDGGKLGAGGAVRDQRETATPLD